MGNDFIVSRIDGGYQGKVIIQTDLGTIMFLKLFESRGGAELWKDMFEVVLKGCTVKFGDEGENG